MTDSHFAVPEESKLVFEEIKNAYNVIKTSNYAMLTRKQLHDVNDFASKNADFSELQCTSRGLAVTTGVTFDDLKALDEMNPYREVTHLKKPGRREGIAYEELLKFAEDIKALAEKVAEFGEALELDFEYEWAEAIHAFRMFMRPFLDDKWRRDYGAWAEIFIGSKDTTKHGAQKLSAIEGREILGYTQAGKPIKNFKGITCEQIDNKTEEAAEAFRYMYKHIPILVFLTMAFKMMKAPSLVDFTEKLSPKLSHSS